MRLLMIVHGRVERPRESDVGVERPRESDAGVERPRDRRVERPSARHSFALCVLLVIIYSLPCIIALVVSHKSSHTD